MTTQTKWMVGIIILVVLIIIGISLTGMSQEASKVPIKVGVLSPLTGPLADYGEEVRRGVQAANVPAGVEFIFEDTACDNPTTLSAFQKLTEFDEVRFLIGPGCGSPQEVISPLLRDKKVLTIVPSAASLNLYDQSGGHFYNIQYSLESESTFIADTLSDLGYDQVALVTYQNAFSKTHADSFRESFQGEIVADIVLLDETTDVASELLKIKQSGAEALYAPDISFFFANGLIEMENFGINIPVFASYVAELPAVRPLVEGVVYSFPSDIIEDEGAVFGLSKQAAEVLGDAVRGCEGEFECVKESLDTSSTFDTNGVSTRAIILKQINNGQAVPFEI